LRKSFSTRFELRSCSTESWPGVLQDCSVRESYQVARKGCAAGCRFRSDPHPACHVILLDKTISVGVDSLQSVVRAKTGQCHRSILSGRKLPAFASIQRTLRPFPRTPNEFPKPWVSFSRLPRLLQRCRSFILQSDTYSGSSASSIKPRPSFGKRANYQM